MKTQGSTFISCLYNNKVLRLRNFLGVITIQLLGKKKTSRALANGIAAISQWFTKKKTRRHSYLYIPLIADSDGMRELYLFNRLNLGFIHQGYRS